MPKPWNHGDHDLHHRPHPARHRPFVLWIPALLLILLGCCFTCCVALLPYLSSVAFLPIFVFFRCYSLGFLAQFGEEWRILQVPITGEVRPIQQ